MLAVILAAGHGSRLMPLTKEIPKPMLKINEKPFLEYLILQFQLKLKNNLNFFIVKKMHHTICFFLMILII